LNLKNVFLEQESLELREVLLSLKSTDSLFLIFLDPVHFGPDGGLLRLVFIDFLLLLCLRKVLINAVVE
jgi:hypothetical protein